MFKREYAKCEICMKTIMNLIPCDQCNLALFCSTDCIENDKFHKIECRDKALDMHDDGIQSVIQSIFLGINTFSSVEHLMEVVEDAIKSNICKVPQSINDMESKYRAFLKLKISSQVKEDKNMLAESYVAYTNLMARDLLKKNDTRISEIF